MKSRWRWVVLAGTVLAAACEGPPPPAVAQIPRPALAQLDEGVRRSIEVARGTFEALDENAPDSARAVALAALGEAYSRAHLLEAALETLLQARRLTAQDFRVEFNLAYVYESVGRLDDAVRSYQHALRLRPDYLEGYVRVGRVLLDFHRLAEAGAAFEKALLGAPTVRSAALMGLGQVSLRRHEYKAAKGYLLQLLKQWPDLGRAHYSLALAYRGLGQTDQAREHLGRHKRLEAESIAAFRAEAEKIPTQAQAYGRRGHAAFNAGRYAEAEKAFRASLAADPAFSPSRLYLARTFFLRGDQPAAIEQFRELLRRDPQHAMGNVDFGKVLARLGETRRAVEHFVRAARTLAAAGNSAQAVKTQGLAVVAAQGLGDGKLIAELKKEAQGYASGGDR